MRRAGFPLRSPALPAMPRSRTGAEASGSGRTTAGGITQQGWGKSGGKGDGRERIDAGDSVVENLGVHRARQVRRHVHRSFHRKMTLGYFIPDMRVFSATPSAAPGLTGPPVRDMRKDEARAASPWPEGTSTSG